MVVVPLDMSKTFDTVNIHKLILTNIARNTMAHTQNSNKLTSGVLQGGVDLQRYLKLISL